MSKIKVLFVVGTLYRAGAERFSYEVDKKLDKAKFELEIFCLERQSFIYPDFGERYYESKHQELGTKIVYSDKFRSRKIDVAHNIIKKIFLKVINNKNKEFKEKKLFHYLDSFDIIHWMGEFTFIHSVPEFIRKKSIIHMMSAKFQNSKIYELYDFNKEYTFCSPFKNDEVSYELSQFNNYDFFVIPLALDVTNFVNKWKFQDTKIKKIGIFTRLNFYKPLDPFFYAFQLLLDVMPDAELHVFGAGDPVQEGMVAMLERIGVANKVFFRGHQENIVETALNEKLSLSWFQGYNNDKPSGYAGLDICLSGTPLICWDFHPNPKSEINLVYPHYKSLNNFVKASLDVLNNEQNAIKLSTVQFIETKNNRDINRWIGKIEKFYIDFHNRSINKLSK